MPENLTKPKSKTEPVSDSARSTEGTTVPETEALLLPLLLYLFLSLLLSLFLSLPRFQIQFLSQTQGGLLFQIWFQIWYLSQTQGASCTRYGSRSLLVLCFLCCSYLGLMKGGHVDGAHCWISKEHRTQLQRIAELIMNTI